MKSGLQCFVCSAAALAGIMLLTDAARGQPGRTRSINPVMNALDVDRDGEISAEEIENAVTALRALDRDRNGSLTRDELLPNFNRGGIRPGRFRRPNAIRRGLGNDGTAGEKSVWDYIADKYDQNGDGKVIRSEYDRGDETYAKLDRDRDGVLTPKDWETNPRPSGRTRQNRSNVADGKAPRVGETAPDFELSYVKQPDKKARLSDFAGKKPVALIFGSCT